MARSVSRGSREKLGFISRARGTVVRGEGRGRIEGERLRNIGWLVCAGTSSQSFPSPSDSLLLPPPLLLPNARFPPAARPGPAPYESLFHSGSPLSSLPSTGSTFLLLSLLSQPPSPQPSFSFSPIRRDGGNCARYTHVLSRTCGSKVFARGGQYSPTTRTIPSHLGKGVGGGRGGRRYDFTQLPWPRHFFPI